MAGPIKNNFAVFTARQKGTDVLEAPNEQGRVGQWIFSNITENSFHWRAQSSGDDAKPGTSFKK